MQHEDSRQDELADSELSPVVGVLELLADLANVLVERERERRWFVLERPRRDTNGGSETEVTVTSKLPANAERNKEIEKIQEREEKAASFGGAVRGSVPFDAKTFFPGFFHTEGPPFPPSR